MLLDAWRRHPQGSLGRLRVASDGPMREVARAAARERTDVEYLGPLDRAGMRAAIAAAACVVAPSTWHDVLPTIILEALAAGRPVLATNLGGMPYLVGSAGWLVEPNAEALGAGLARAYAEAPALAGPAGSARLRYTEHFAPDVLVDRLINIYREVVKR